VAESIISKLSVMLSLNSAKFRKGVDDAGKGLDHLKGELRSLPGADVFDKLRSGPLGAAAAVVGATVALGALVKSQMAAIDASAKLADSLGFTTEALAGLQFAADLSGVDSEELAANMARLTKKLGDAEQGGAEAEKALAKLGLSAADLNGLAPDAALGKIADGMAQVPTKAQQAAVAMELFGKSGYKMLPLLAEGSEGMKRLSREAKALGLAVTKIESKSVEKANDAFTRLWSGVKGIGSQLSVAVAPALTTIANALTVVVKIGVSWVTGLKDVIQFYGDILAKLGELIPALDGVEKLAGKAGTLLTNVTLGFMAGGPVGAAAAAAATVAYQIATAAAEQFYGSLEHHEQLLNEHFAQKPDTAVNRRAAAMEAAAKKSQEMRKEITALTERLQLEAETVGMTADQVAIYGLEKKKVAAHDLSAAKLAAATKANNELAKAVDDLDKKLQRQSDTFGMTADEIEVYDLRARGATDAMLEGVGDKIYAKRRKDRDKAAAKADFEALAKDLDDASRIFDSVQTPFDKYEDKMVRLEELLYKGMLDWETYQAAVAKAGAELDGALGKGDDKKPAEMRLGSAAQRGSAEAISAVSRFQFAGQLKQSDTLPALLRDQVAEAKRQNQKLDKLLDAVKDQGVAVAEFN